MNDHTLAAQTPRTLRDLLSAQAGMALSTDDVLVLVLPLFAQVAALHAQGRVASLDPDAIVLTDAGDLALRQPDGLAPRLAFDAIARVQPPPHPGLNIVGTLRLARTDDGGTEAGDLALQNDPAAPAERPAYIAGPVCWEHTLGHHDEIGDVFLLGMLLAALACGFDFAREADLRTFAGARRNLFAVAPRLHPVLAAVIVEATELNRHGRATDVAALAARLRTWRDQPPSLDIERALAGAEGLLPRRAAVLGNLRDRLFDLSRRNRLLYFRPSAGTVNLTVASVPLMLQVERIEPSHICTWSGPFAADLVAGKPVALGRWLRFEDQPYLPGALDRLVADTRRDRAEFGFGNLRLVVAFFRWHNLKEEPDERITSPLLWLPVELQRRKGVRDQYVLQCEDGEAEYNPVLRHQLAQLYDIRLPEKVDLAKTSLAEIHADILAQIRRTEPAVELRMVEKASIRLVRQKALQRLQLYQRRKPRGAAAAPAGALPSYSYARDDYRPLGRALYEQRVRPTALPQRFEAGAMPAPRQPQMTAVDERQGYVLQESEGHRYAWDLDLTQVTLANFNYRKMSLVRDYTQLLAEPAPNPAFDRVFSIEPRALDTSTPAPLPLREQWNVVAADATQNAAVALARTDRSFIIQGPPGTGKSQSITNLVADYVARGKRVLFVCEKRAALDVVYNRLKQSGLDALCCLIHDSQADKKAFVADLRTCYERWIAQEGDDAGLARRRDALLAGTEAQQARIDALENALAAAPADVGTSVRALLRRCVALEAPPASTPAERERLPALAAWDGMRDTAQRLQRFVLDRAGLGSLAAHPFALLDAAIVRADGAYRHAEHLCARGEELVDMLERAIEDGRLPFGRGTGFGAARAMAADARWLLDAGLAGHLALLDSAGAGRAALRNLEAGIEASARGLEQARAVNLHWRDKLNPRDTQAALALARRLEGSPLRWLQGAWWRLRAELRRRYDFTRHAIHPGYTAVLEALAAEHDAAAAHEQAGRAAAAQYGVADLHAFTAALAEFEGRTRANARLRELVALLQDGPDPAANVHAAAAAGEALDGLAALAHAGLALSADTSLEGIGEALRDLREALDDLPDALPLLQALHAGDPACVAALRTLPHGAGAIEALVADEALRRLERTLPVLADVDGAVLAHAARAVAAGQQALLRLNAQVIGAGLQRRFAAHVRLSATSATQLDAEAKAFKKRYANGRRELEHEFGKTMRYRSIRDLADDDTGAVVNDLKPVWLMSPLSVSDTLPLAPDLFDVVIFDEASQIPVEEAVPALSRARQVVVVGDEMQLPPTSFFAAGASADDDLVVEENGERIAISLDADSLLAQAARNLPATLLAWHYRSRHEALISFSNAAFYEGRLVTIPDRTVDRPDQPATPVGSADPDAGAAGFDALMRRAVSFHRIADGVYGERRNLPEARYIAQVVKEMLGRGAGLSVGVVAFSEAQQAAIEDALEALAAEDPDFGARLEREYVREDDGQFNGLFVKNLENVQGDERDVIILSICYAPGADRKMLMNFGPINTRGGEKRLNVIFSRARHRMAVVSSIGPEAITNVHNDGAAALRSFLQFAQASSCGQFAQAQAVLGALNPGARLAFARPVEPDAIRDALAAALRARGHRVDVDVGRSQFRCDLALVGDDGDYALGLLLDAPGRPVGDTIERYVFRPAILRAFGWRVLDILGRDWVHDSARVIERIEMALSGKDEAAQDPDIAPAAAPTAAVATPAPAPDDADAAWDVERRLESVQGESRKFWRAALRGAALQVNYGRIGSSGQVVLKEFDSAQRALREMDRLVEEKLRKGYVDAAGAQ